MRPARRRLLLLALVIAGICLELVACGLAPGIDLPGVDGSGDGITSGEGTGTGTTTGVSSGSGGSTSACGAPGGGAGGDAGASGSCWY